MIWGCFGGGDHGTVYPTVVKSVNARVYLKLLEYLVFPVAQSTNGTIDDAVFQQYNAPVHTASVTTEWLEQHNIQVDEHPPYSPGLNPIKHVRVVLEQQLHKQYPDIVDTSGGLTGPGW